MCPAARLDCIRLPHRLQPETNQLLVKFLPVPPWEHSTALRVTPTAPLPQCVTASSSLAAAVAATVSLWLIIIPSRRKPFAGGLVVWPVCLLALLAAVPAEQITQQLMFSQTLDSAPLDCIFPKQEIQNYAVCAKLPL
jgi:hypothetical protein